jgi:hypothetical protein
MTVPVPTPTGEDPTMTALRTALLAQGLAPAAVEAALAAAAPTVKVYRVSDAVTDALTALTRDLPDSSKGALPAAARRRAAGRLPLPVPHWASSARCCWSSAASRCSWGRS